MLVVGTQTAFKFLIASSVETPADANGDSPPRPISDRVRMSLREFMSDALNCFLFYLGLKERESPQTHILKPFVLSGLNFSFLSSLSLPSSSSFGVLLARNRDCQCDCQCDDSHCVYMSV